MCWEVMALCNMLEQSSSLGDWSLNPTAACLYSLCHRSLGETECVCDTQTLRAFGELESNTGSLCTEAQVNYFMYKRPVSSLVTSTGERAQSVLTPYKWPICHVNYEELKQAQCLDPNVSSQVLTTGRSHPLLYFTSLYLFDPVVPSFRFFMSHVLYNSPCSEFRVAKLIGKIVVKPFVSLWRGDDSACTIS